MCKANVQGNVQGSTLHTLGFMFILHIWVLRLLLQISSIMFIIVAVKNRLSLKASVTTLGFCFWYFTYKHQSRLEI